MTGREALDYGDEYIDIEIHGHAWDIVHGQGVYETGKQDCYERMTSSRNLRAETEPEEESQMDHEAYGPGFEIIGCDSLGLQSVYCNIRLHCLL